MGSSSLDRFLDAATRDKYTPAPVQQDAATPLESTVFPNEFDLLLVPTSLRDMLAGKAKGGNDLVVFARYCPTQIGQHTPRDYDWRWGSGPASHYGHFFHPDLRPVLFFAVARLFLGLKPWDAQTPSKWTEANPGELLLSVSGEFQSNSPMAVGLTRWKL